MVGLAAVIGVYAAFFVGMSTWWGSARAAAFLGVLAFAAIAKATKRPVIMVR